MSERVLTQELECPSNLLALRWFIKELLKSNKTAHCEGRGSRYCPSLGTNKTVPRWRGCRRSRRVWTEINYISQSPPPPLRGTSSKGVQNTKAQATERSPLRNVNASTNTTLRKIYNLINYLYQITILQNKIKPMIVFKTGK